MKFKILNNEPLHFYNTYGDLIGTISVSESGDMIIQPESGSTRNITIGDPNVAGDVEVGLVSAPVNFTMLGGGTITSNGNTLNIGSAINGDTVNLYNVTYSQSLEVTGSVDVTGLVNANSFIGNILDINSSASFSGLPNSEPIITGSLWISGSSIAHPNSGYLMIFNP